MDCPRQVDWGVVSLQEPVAGFHIVMHKSILGLPIFLCRKIRYDEQKQKERKGYGMKKRFNDGWEFAKTDITKTKEELTNVTFEQVDLPHDWLIHQTKDLYETSYGWYRKKFRCEKVREKEFRLYFEGIYMDSTIYVNGREAFEWKNGYASFEVNLTEYVTEGENEILVLVRHIAPNTRWYSGAGIYRNVWMKETGKTYLVTDGVYINVQKENGDWKCKLDIEISGETKGQELNVQIVDQNNQPVYEKTILVHKNTIKEEFVIPADQVETWDCTSPILYELMVQLKENGSVVDELSQKIGFREICFTPDNGFFLNGRNVKIQGVCLHHDLGSLGAAVNREAIKRQLLLMKEMGANAIRTSHNMPAVEVMELCDELGLLVDSEAYDTWERSKTEHDYARFFLDWYELDVASWIRRDRNHPSVIMWSIGNEIYDTHASSRGLEVTKLLREEVKKHDPYHNAYITIGSNYMGGENARLCADEVDLAGYNYGEKLYADHHETYQTWCIYGSETSSGVKSRGVYHFPAESVFLTHEDLQCSSLGNCRGGFYSETAADVIIKNRDTKYCAGMFIWTGIDYIGEPSPYFTKNAYYGQCDTAGIKKDSFYLYQAAWTNQPVLHLMPYWDFNEGQLIDVIVFSNLKEVELFLNGKPQGKKQIEKFEASWQVPYEEGEIKVVGISEDGTSYVDSRHSFGDSVSLHMSANKTHLKADGEDLVAVTIWAEDVNGYPVENARDRVQVAVTGGRLLGFDNGDSTDYDEYKGSSRRLFSGKAVALIGAPVTEGELVVEASAMGLSKAMLTLPVEKAVVEPGIGTSGLQQDIIQHSNMDRECQTDLQNKEVCIRKIQLVRKGSLCLTKACPEVEVQALLSPKNATYQQVEWSIVTNSGITSSIASLAVDGLTATLRANGDGQCRLRCVAYNGRPQPEVISEYEVSIEGMGQVTVDPYVFQPACLYTDSKAQLGETAQGGVAILENNPYVAFSKVDFGEYGSKIISLKMIHWFTDDPLTVRLWDGIPYQEDAVLLGEFTYQAEFLWQTYKENTFALCEPICGVRTICFEFEKKENRLDFGGFCFTPILKAYEKIPATKNDMIHGDSFEKTAEAIAHIGNNVCLEFDKMNFAQGISNIQITGKTYHDNDSIHLHIISDSGEEMEEIVEFPFSEEVTTVTKSLSDMRGNTVVNFKFLPGCEFDFHSFQFHPFWG